MMIDKDKLMDGKAGIDAVFCDLGMPLMNGWEVARRVKSIERNPIFYLLTGWAAEIPADDPRRRLVDAVIAKPLDLTILDSLLAEHAPFRSGSATRTETEGSGIVLSARP
jgi:CheY-like chemotaxis protein